MSSHIPALRLLARRDKGAATVCRTKAAMQLETTQLSSHVDAIPDAQAKDAPGGIDWVVQKFGGTSLSKAAVTTAQDIVL